MVTHTFLLVANRAFTRGRDKVFALFELHRSFERISALCQAYKLRYTYIQVTYYYLDNSS